MPRFDIDPDIAKARTPDTAFYTDPQLFREAKEKLFAPSWQFVGDTDQVRQPGDMVPFTLLADYLDEPLLLVRDQGNALHLLSNVCTHRGNILVHEPCSSPHIRCRYHGRQFHPDGKFRSMPEFKEVLDFPSPADDLARLPLFQWGKWLFTSPGLSSDPGHFLGDMIDRLRWLPFSDYQFRPDRSRDFSVKAHWALYCENYLEGFHIPFVHAGLNEVIDFGSYTTELFRYSNLQLGIAREDEDCFDLPPGSPDYGKKVAAYYFFIFPNLMFNFYPWGLSVNIVMPVSLRETRVAFRTYVADESRYDKGAGAGLDRVEGEDEEVVEAVQKGIRSRFYRHGRYSVTREQGTHHFHRIIAGLME
ncbi:MAG: aromatic ring-hydroxylating dioxygenase subunit alpha [Bacteroidota bacterium]|nr:aromatic ring-hydroxylating dioxygenase subunit alpha [Bacteroidota bacterium]MDP4215927.1 aromatic ring-hydroxylating dioxygenase subunit alpha [Bacteroidota bacterium]MDP4254586.1 aromatic ring-hydroxylating dioxygenase subunit alpha [Bacteroidota bacterium]